MGSNKAAYSADGITWSNEEYYLEYPSYLQTLAGVDKTDLIADLLGGAKIETGSYTGTGTYGNSNPNSLTFGFEPKIVFISESKPEYSDGVFIIKGMSRATHRIQRCL